MAAVGAGEAGEGGSDAEEEAKFKTVSAACSTHSMSSVRSMLRAPGLALALHDGGHRNWLGR